MQKAENSGENTGVLEDLECNEGGASELQLLWSGG